jgi:hypothetical protein
MQDIHPNLPLIEFPIFTILDWLILGIFAGILVYTWWSKKEKLSLISKPQKIVKSKVILAKFSLSKELQKLEKLKAAKNWKKFVLQATEILKKSLEQKYQKPFLFATGRELMSELQNKVSAGELGKFRDFFQLADPVKFADQDLAEAQADKVLDFLKTLK